MTDALDVSWRSAKPMASRKRAAPATLPANAAWLDHVMLSMAVDRSEGGADRDSHRLHLHLHHSGRRSRVMYELTVQYAPPATAADASVDEAMAWVVRRSFSEYVALQQRLLARLRPGHACHAECAWLYNVLKHHFPKKSLFCSACKVENRRKALMRVLTTVRASVVNRGNLVCSVLRDSVCQEFAAFLLGDAATEGESSSSSGGSSRGSISEGKSAVVAVASAPLLTLASKRITKHQSSTSLMSFASEASMPVLEAEDDYTNALRERSSSCCSSASSSTCDGLRHYYRRGSSSAASTTTSGSACCRRQHRDQFRDDYALETPTHAATAVTCGCEQAR